LLHRPAGRGGGGIHSGFLTGLVSGSDRIPSAGRARCRHRIVGWQQQWTAAMVAPVTRIDCMAALKAPGEANRRRGFRLLRLGHSLRKTQL
jgi:hypothetical protein